MLSYTTLKSLLSMKSFNLLLVFFFVLHLNAQNQLFIPPETDARLYDIANAPSPTNNLECDAYLVSLASTERILL